MKKLKKSKKVSSEILHKTPLQRGAVIILANIVFLPLLAWGGVTIVGSVERIARLEEKRNSQKELILRVDKKVDNHSTSIREVNSKLDKILFIINGF